MIYYYRILDCNKQANIFNPYPQIYLKIFQNKLRMGNMTIMNHWVRLVQIKLKLKKIINQRGKLWENIKLLWVLCNMIKKNNMKKMIKT